MIVSLIFCLQAAGSELFCITAQLQKLDQK